MEPKELDFPICWETPPSEILEIIEIANSLLADSMQRGQPRVPGLVNSNFFVAYHALQEVLQRQVFPGFDPDERLSFCEWGSGLGVVTCIAAYLGYDATGIEIEPSLCGIAAKLAENIGVQASFIEGTYRLQDDHLDERCNVDASRPFPMGSWNADVIYAYPWPAEEEFIGSLFSRSDCKSSVLITYHGGPNLRVRKKSRVQDA